MRSYRKVKQGFKITELSADELIRMFTRQKSFVALKFSLIILSLCALSFFIKGAGIFGNTDDLVVEDSTISLAEVPLNATSAKKDLISIPAGTVKANPFLPYRDISGSSTVSDVPTYDLVAPPDAVNDTSDAVRVM